MSQIFHPSANTYIRATIVGAVIVVHIVVGGLYAFSGSPYQTGVKVIRNQPVPFSHEHHIRGVGIDCRYCHNTVETSASAGFPPTYTCMSCHSQIWGAATILEPVRASLAENKPISWTRVHDLPDYVYFNHSIHIQKGVGCVSCHGQVDKMPLAWKAEPMTMTWCLNCHQHPEQFLRDKKDVFRMDLVLSNEEQLAKGHELVSQNKIDSDRLINCSVCHR